MLCLKRQKEEKEGLGVTPCRLRRAPIFLDCMSRYLIDKKKNFLLENPILIELDKIASKVLSNKKDTLQKRELGCSGRAYI